MNFSVLLYYLPCYYIYCVIIFIWHIFNKNSVILVFLACEFDY